jgi:hypothetical protein
MKSKVKMNINPNETKGERFARLGHYRVNHTLDEIRKLVALGGYMYSENSKEQRELKRKYIQKLMSAINTVEMAWQATNKADRSEFTVDDPDDAPIIADRDLDDDTALRGPDGESIVVSEPVEPVSDDAPVRTYVGIQRDNAPIIVGERAFDDAHGLSAIVFNNDGICSCKSINCMRQHNA